MKILQISCGGLGNGGVQAVIMDICRNMPETQFDILLFTNESRYYDDEFKKLGGKIFRIPNYEGNNKYKKKNLDLTNGGNKMAEGCNLHLTRPDIKQVEDAINIGQKTDTGKIARDLLNTTLTNDQQEFMKVLRDKNHPYHKLTQNLLVNSLGKDKVTKQEAIIFDPAKGKVKYSIDELAKHFTGVALELSPNTSFIEKERKPVIAFRDLNITFKGLKTSFVPLFVLSLMLQFF